MWTSFHISAVKNGGLTLAMQPWLNFQTALLGQCKKVDDPTAGVKLPEIKGKRYRTLDGGGGFACEAAYPPGTRERLIYEGYVCTALRRSDMARLDRQDLRQRKPGHDGSF